jgi:hypothetical protein
MIDDTGYWPPKTLNWEDGTGGACVKGDLVHRCPGVLALCEGIEKQSGEDEHLGPEDLPLWLDAVFDNVGCALQFAVCCLVEREKTATRGMLAREHDQRAKSCLRKKSR